MPDVTTLPTPERPWLVGDVGGTNARFAVVYGAGGELEDVRVFRSADHRDLVGLVGAYLQHLKGDRPVAACIAFAGPIVGDRCRATNVGLEFSIQRSRQALQLDHLEVIHDLGAVAVAATALGEEYGELLGHAKPRPGLPLAVVGAGTGLGVATLATADRPVVLAGEGGHVTLAARDDLEFEVLRAASEEGEALTTEMIVSGPGLERLHRLLAKVWGRAPESLPAAEISAHAMARTDDLCGVTLRTFCHFLSTVAASVALTVGARGGVYLTGGVLTSVAPFLAESEFRQRFEASPVMGEYLARIATVLLTHPYPALRGAATMLQMRS